MEQNPIFVENPQLKDVYGTCDGEFFYKRNVYYPNLLDVADGEVLEETVEEETTETGTTEESTGETETTSEETDETVTTEEAPAEEVTTEEAPAETVTTEEAPAVKSSTLDDRLRAFHAQTTEYPEALDLFIDLKLVAASRKKVDVYAALTAAQSQLK